MTVVSMFGPKTSNNYVTPMFFVSSKNNTSNEVLYCNLINNKDVIKIVDYYIEFSLGKIESLEKKLTLDEYNRLSIVLYELSEEKFYGKNNYRKYYNKIYDSCYEKIRINIVRSLEALMKAIEINNELNTTKKILESHDNAIKTYSDIKALADRYNHLKEMQKSTMSSFLNVDVIMPLLQLKLEYAEYIKKYGYPEGGIFESDKMAEILDKLGNHGNVGDVENCDDISLHP
jgi:hypothetical protein